VIELLYKNDQREPVDRSGYRSFRGNEDVKGLSRCAAREARPWRPHCLGKRVAIAIDGGKRPRLMSFVFSVIISGGKTARGRWITTANVTPEKYSVRELLSPMRTFIL
jgi:hypothetical protein